MDVTLSLNEESREYYSGNNSLKSSYFGSLRLTKAFINREHNLTIIHPNDVYKKGKDIYSRKVFSFNSFTGFYQTDTNSLLTGDTFFIYGLGEDKDFDISRKFMDFLYPLENQYEQVLNSAESTSYEFKPKQKKLDFPWIPSFEVKSQSDLIDIVLARNNIIAKPSVGFSSRGIIYIGGIEDVSKIEKDCINHYLYEKFIPADEERRYIFLNDDLIIRRRMGKRGSPGKEYASSVDLMEGYSHEISIARRVISETGMFYGAVDFRGNYLLEFNGSGTGIAPPTINGQDDPYNLSSVVVQAVERKFEGFADEALLFEKAHSL